eukprot:10302753-Prorocentrum_lima.AAC.1
METCSVGFGLIEDTIEELPVVVACRWPKTRWGSDVASEAVTAPNDLHLFGLLAFNACRSRR